MDKRQKRVLILSASFFSHGGIARYNRFLARALADSGYRVEVISLCDPSGEMRFSAGEVRVMASTLSLGAKIRFAFCAFGRLLSRRYSFVFCLHVHFSVLAGFLCLLTRQKFVVCTHGDEVWNRPRFLAPFFLRRAARVLTVSEFTAAQLAFHYRLNRERIFLLRNCVDDMFLSPPPGGEQTKPARFSGRVILLSVGRVSRSSMGKGYAEIIALLPSLLKIEPRLVYVVAGGGDGIETLRAYSEKFHVSEHVILAGAVSDEELLRYYRDCDIFVLASRFVKKNEQWVEGEGFGIVLIEAAASAKPVVAIREGGSAEAVQDGVNGFLVDPGSETGLYEKLVLLIRDAALRRRMGECGRKWVEAHFTFHRFEQDVENMVHTLDKST